jgi:hypothetical protein
MTEGRMRPRNGLHLHHLDHIHWHSLICILDVPNLLSWLRFGVCRSPVSYMVQWISIYTQPTRDNLLYWLNYSLWSHFLSTLVHCALYRSTFGPMTFQQCHARATPPWFCILHRDSLGFGRTAIGLKDSIAAAASSAATSLRHHVASLNFDTLCSLSSRYAIIKIRVLLLYTYDSYNIIQWTR